MKKLIITACLSLMALVVFAQVAPNPSGQVKPVPQVSADKMLQTIVSSYRGQVLLVDFWATWCGPCRYGHKVIEPLKKTASRMSSLYISPATLLPVKTGII